jgi:hypothetical protein
MTKLFRMRKLFARILLPFLTIWLCVMPGRAYATGVLTFGAYGMPTIGATGSYPAALAALDFAAVGAGAFTVGLYVGYFGLEAILGDGTPQHVRIPLSNAPAIAVPAPVAAPTASSVSSTVYSACGVTSKPLDVLLSACNSWYSGTAGFSALGVYGNYLEYRSGTTTVSTYSGGAPYSGCNQYPASTGGIIVSPSTATSCPSGYNLSAGSCVLSDARVAAPDHACDYARSGSALSMISDPDCAASGQAIPVICASGGVSCSGQGVSPSGKPESYVITPTANGGSTVTFLTQGTVNGQTQVQRTDVAVGSDGKVVSVSGDVFAGSIPASADGSAAVPVTSGSTVQNPAPSQPITFPNDYARTGEAQTAANTITPKLDTIHHDLSDTVATTDPAEPTVNDMPTWGSTFTNLLSWQMPAHSSVCPQPSMDLSNVLGSGHVYTLSSHCALLQDHSAPIHQSMVLVFSILALFIVLRA